MNKSNTGFSPESLRLIGAALALHQVECISASITPLPGTGRFIAIGTPAEVARLLEIAPAAGSASPAAADESYLHDARHPKDMTQAMEWIVGLRNRVDNLPDKIHNATPSSDDVRNAALPDVEEASEILENFISNVSQDGPYSAEAMLTFIGQAKQCVDSAIRALKSAAAQSVGEKGQNSEAGGVKPLARCAAARDGECRHVQCPQLRDNEPAATGRHCPLDNHNDGEAGDA